MKNLKYYTLRWNNGVNFLSGVGNFFDWAFEYASRKLEKEGHKFMINRVRDEFEFCLDVFDFALNDYILENISDIRYKGSLEVPGLDYSNIDSILNGDIKLEPFFIRHLEKYSNISPSASKRIVIGDTDTTKMSFNRNMLHKNIYVDGLRGSE